MKEVRVLWTGGWDSTFRIVELSRQEIVIKPIYVCDEGRKSKDYELIAMDNIIKALNNKKETKAKIMPIEIINKEDIPKDEEITKAYNSIREQTKLGTQNEWLAWLAKDNPGLEMGIVLSSPEISNMHYTIKKFGKLIYKDGIGYIDKENSSEELNMLLGNFAFPIIQKTETDMVKLIKEWGYEDVMKHIWFCHQPINGEKCGFCHPCTFKLKSNMDFLLPKKAQRRYKTYKFTNKVLGKKITNIIFYIYRKIKTK